MAVPDIALIAPYPRSGVDGRADSGVASYTRDLAHSLVRRGASIRVIAPSTDIDGHLEYHDGVPVQRRIRSGPRAFASGVRAACDSGARVVHIQHELFLYGGAVSAPTIIPALIKAKAARLAPVVTMHQVVSPASIDRDFVEMHRIRAPEAAARGGLRLLQGAIPRLARRTIVHEPHFSDVIPDATVIPHGVVQAPARDRRKARSGLGLDGRLTVLCFGFIAPYKGLELVLEAAALCNDVAQIVVAGGEHPRLEGRDPYARDLRDRYGSVAHFTGYVPHEQVAEWFIAADVALFPYPRPHASSGPLALALGHGTPVLASRAMARADGPLTLPEDPRRLAELIRELVAYPGRLDDLRARSRRLAAERTWSKVADAHLELYEEIA